MNYINMKEGRNSVTETIDEFEDYREAKRMLKEYRMSYPASIFLYVSQRSTKSWRTK